MRAGDAERLFGPPPPIELGVRIPDGRPWSREIDVGATVRLSGIDAPRQVKVTLEAGDVVLHGTLRAVGTPSARFTGADLGGWEWEWHLDGDEMTLHDLFRLFDYARIEPR